MTPGETNNQMSKKKLDLMKLRILELEKENLKTRERSNDAMIETIRRIIMDEVNKKY